MRYKIFKPFLLIALIVVLVFQMMCSSCNKPFEKKVTDATESDSTVKVTTIPATPSNDVTLEDLMDSLNNVQPEVSTPVSVEQVLQPTSDLYRTYWMKVIETKRQQDIEQIYKTFGKNFSVAEIEKLANESGKYSSTTYDKNAEFLNKLLDSYVAGAARRINIDKDGVITVVNDPSKSVKTPKLK